VRGIRLSEPGDELASAHFVGNNLRIVKGNSVVLSKLEVSRLYDLLEAHQHQGTANQ
jgi:hypothetical protein